MLRTAVEGSQKLLALHNVTDQPQQVKLQPQLLGLEHNAEIVDLISQEKFVLESARPLHVKPYQSLWLSC